MKLSACAATVKLVANERKMIAVRALAGTEPVSTLAARHGVSRPLVYRQMHKASAALDELFSPTQTDDADPVLFSLPVTRRWLEQATLGLTMIAHASMRGVVEFMHDVLGVSISLGTVHNIHQRAAQHTVAINDSVTSFFRARSPYSPALTLPRPTAICWPPKIIATATPGPSICST